MSNESIRKILDDNVKAAGQISPFGIPRAIAYALFVIADALLEILKELRRQSEK